MNTVSGKQNEAVTLSNQPDIKIVVLILFSDLHDIENLSTTGSVPVLLTLAGGSSHKETTLSDTYAIQVT